MAMPVHPERGSQMRMIYKIAGILALAAIGAMILIDGKDMLSAILM